MEKTAAQEQFQRNLNMQPWSSPFWVADVIPTREYDGGMRIIPWGKHELPDMPLWIWEMPVPDRAYTVALDPSFKRDPAAIQVVDFRGSQVAEMLYSSWNSAIWLAEFYNNASLVIEMNGPGVSAFDYLRHRYKNIWYDQCGELNQPGPGFTLHGHSRKRIIWQFQQSMVLPEPILHSTRMRQQLMAFFDNDRECEDDLVISFLEAHYCSQMKTYMRRFS